MIKTRMKNMRTNKIKKRGKKRDPARSGNLPQGPVNTIRSKIEDKLTEEKLKDRGSAENANTPWAPSGPERIEFAYGKGPLRAHREGQGAKVRVRRPGVLGIFSGCFAESVF
jgi:hypothetical protein